MHDSAFEPILALHIINFSSRRNYWGGGAKRYVCPPNIFMGGGGDCPPAPPGSTPLGASDLDGQGGMCTVADPGFAKMGWAEKSVRVAHRVCAKRASYGWGAGARRRAPPCRGPGGEASGSSRVFSK